MKQPRSRRGALDARLAFLAPTVAGAAARFAVRFGDRWRWCPRRKTWFVRGRDGWEADPKRRALRDDISRSLSMVQFEEIAIPARLNDVIHARPRCAPTRRSTALGIWRSSVFGAIDKIELAARDMLAWCMD